MKVINRIDDRPTDGNGLLPSYCPECDGNLDFKRINSILHLICRECKKAIKI